MGGLAVIAGGEAATVFELIPLPVAQFVALRPAPLLRLPRMAL